MSDSPRPGSKSGSIYDGRSQAGQLALAGLRTVLQEIGFIVEKERASEGSLRVYPEQRHRYPLLNPQFVRAGRTAAGLMSTPSIVFDVYSDDDESISALLKQLPVAGEWSFKPAPQRANHGRYRLHGRFVVPLELVGGRSSQEVDFESLRGPLREMHTALTAGLLVKERLGRVE